MSSYNSGYHGSALVLDKKEFDELISRYKEIIVSKLKKTLQDDFEYLVMSEECLLREYPFIRSVYCTENPNKILEDGTQTKVFEILDVSTDDCDGMYLLPYLNDGKLLWSQNSGISLRDKNLYVIFSDHQLDNPLTFVTKPYESYEAFVNEFKEKLKNYLPEDFNWDKHIGSFSYSCYA